MNKTPKYVQEVQELLANHESGKDDQDTRPHDTNMPLNEIDVYVEEDRITLMPKRLHGKPVGNMPVDEKELQGIIDSILIEPDTYVPQAPAQQPPTPSLEQDEKTSRHVGLLTISLFMLIALSSIVFQVNMILNPPIATITIIPKSQTVTLTGTLQLGRVLPAITLSQERTVPTTGRGHQDAKQATGSITFYNGLFSEQTVASGTILTGSDGVHIVTTQDAVIPAATPSPLAFGYITVAAQATSTGSSGNISAYDINQTCCASGIVAKNTQNFTGGQDERNFQTVTKHDIDGVAMTLKTTLAQSMRGALQSQLQQGEQFQTFPCSPTVTPDHQIGTEATLVKVTLSLKCSGSAYNSQELEARVTQLLTSQAIKKLGTGYSELGTVSVNVNQATVTTSHPTIAFSSSGVWVYGLSDAAQQHLKILIAGKTTQNALHILASQPGIERVATQWDENTKLPKDPQNIHLALFYLP